MIGFQIVSSLGLSLMGAYAYYRLTTPEPHQSSPRTSRAVARWSILPGYIFGIFGAVLAVISDPAIMIAGGILQSISGIMSVVGLIAILIYLRYLALRIPNRTLAKHTTTVLWGFGITLSLMTLGVIVIILLAVAASSGSSGGSSGPAGPVAALGCLMCPLIIGMLVFGIWWIVLMCQYYGAFAKAHKQALHQQRADGYSERHSERY